MKFRRFWTEQHGAAMVEYSVLLAICAAALIASVAAVGNWIQSTQSEQVSLYGIADSGGTGGTGSGTGGTGSGGGTSTGTGTGSGGTTGSGNGNGNGHGGNGNGNGKNK